MPRVSEVIGYRCASMVEPALHAGAACLRFIPIRRLDFSGIGSSFNVLADKTGRLSQWVKVTVVAKHGGSHGGDGAASYLCGLQGVIERAR